MTSGGATILHVEACGPATSLQDVGRFGWQRFGVGPAGAMDAGSLARANLLVGNVASTAAIELALSGGRFRVEGGAVRVAIGGAQSVLMVDGAAIAAYTSAMAGDGSVIEVGGVAGGVFCYLAIAGGFEIRPALGSLSLHARAQIGGLHGRALSAGDRLPLRRQTTTGLDLTGDPPAERTGPIRVLLGPQDDYFQAEALATFLSATFEISPQSDRMGQRLIGPKIAHNEKGFNIVSDGIATGAIQVPGSGEPLVLLADRQTTGGYPKIATVITADLARLGQSRPGTRLRFEAVTRIEAVAALQAQRIALDAFAASLRPAGLASLDSERLLGLELVDGWIDALG